MEGGRGGEEEEGRRGGEEEEGRRGGGRERRRRGGEERRGEGRGGGRKRRRGGEERRGREEEGIDDLRTLICYRNKILITFWALDFSHFVLHMETTSLACPTEVIVCTGDAFISSAIYSASATITFNSRVQTVWERVRETILKILNSTRHLCNAILLLLLQTLWKPDGSHIVLLVATLIFAG